MKSTQTVVVFPDPPASMPELLFADFEITGRKRPIAFVASYGILGNRGGVAVDHHPYHHGAGPYS